MPLQYVEVAAGKRAQNAPILDENPEGSMCEMGDAISDPSASDLCVTCSGLAPKRDADHSSSSSWHARWKRSWVSRESTRLGQRTTQATKTAARSERSLVHTTHASSPTSSTKSPQMDRQDQRRTLVRRSEETPVCAGGARRAGSNCREPPRGCTLIHQMGRQPRPGTRRGRRHRPRTLLLHDELASGMEHELGGAPFDSWIDVSGSSIFSHGHAWHPTESTLRKAAPGESRQAS